jgi:hypothetical protein
VRIDKNENEYSFDYEAEALVGVKEKQAIEHFKKLILEEIAKIKTS